MLHALIMPTSRYVHIVRLIVTKAGELEFAEWITGEDGKYAHRTGQLDENAVAALADSLSNLHIAEQAINFDGINFDYDKYEGTERQVLRFWSDHVRRDLSLPIPDFYKDYGISVEAKAQYERAFNSVVTKMPLEWIT